MPGMYIGVDTGRLYIGGAEGSLQVASGDVLECVRMYGGIQRGCSIGSL